MANDVVVEQVDTSYDKNSNVIQTATHERFSTDPQTGANATGPLGYAFQDVSTPQAAYVPGPFDASGHGDSGTSVGGVTYNASGGPNGGAYNTFDGSTGYIDAGNPSNLNFAGQITISAWVNVSDLSVGKDEGLVVHSASGQATFLKLSFGTYQAGGWNGTGNNFATYAIPSGDVGQWVQLVATYDGTNWDLYRDGTLVATQASSLGALSLSGGDWTIGGSSNALFHGSIADVRIFNTALSAQAVALLYTSQPGARVLYYMGYFYDPADRLTDTVNPGTDGGNLWTRPTSPPASSDTDLVTTTSYLADTVQTVALGPGETTGNLSLTFNGQTANGIAVNVTGAQLQADLAALSTIGTGNVSVTGPAGGPWVVRFIGALAGANQPLMIAISQDSGGHSQAISVVTTLPGGDAGLPQRVTDPRGIVNVTDYDMLGRAVDTIAAFTTGVPTNTSDQMTQQTYDGIDDVLTATAVQPATDNSTASQTTAYVHGIGITVGQDLFSNDLVRTVEYPDKTTGLPATSDPSQQQQFGYNLLGEETSFTDQNGTTHVYLRDVLARLTADIVTNINGNTDRTIQRLGYSFNALGLPFQQTSYGDTAGTQVKNQVEDLYNGYGQLTQQYQEHSGPVGPASSPQVQYAYSTGDNNSRLTSETYPNARVIDYKYTTTLDSAISRVDQIYDATGSHVGNDQSYTYLGLSTIVQETDGNGTALSYLRQPGQINLLTDGGDEYTGVDRFGRVDDQNWFNTSTGVSTDRFQYAYDRNSNVLYKNNLLDPAMSELYHANSTSSGDNNTAYDPLNRLKSFTRGTLSASGHNGSSLDQVAGTNPTNNWSYDAVDNVTATQNGSQTRQLNAQNQITSISGQSGIFYYENGNLEEDGNNNRFFYDAWNRLVTVSTATGSYASYSYDALGRRISEGSTGFDLYYDGSNNVIEERYGSQVIRQTVWGLGTNNLVLFDFTGTRYYVQQDAVGNVTSTTDTSGNVYERIIYDPYGTPTTLQANWQPGSYGTYLAYGFQGGRTDPISGLVHFGARDYDPSLQRWIQAEPYQSNYIDGMNLTAAMGNNPVTFVDPSGLDHRFQDPTDPYGGIADLTNNNPAYSHGLGTDPQAGIRNWNNNMQYCRDRAAAAAAEAARKAKNLAKAMWRDAIEGLFTSSVRGVPSLRDFGPIRSFIDTIAPPCDDAAANRAAPFVLFILGAIIGEGMGAGEPSPGEPEPTPAAGETEPVTPTEKPALPEDYWKGREAPTQVEPGTDPISEMKPSSRKRGEVYERRTYYDKYGRSTGQTHFTDHGEPGVHPNPHYHLRDPATGEETGPFPGIHPSDPEAQQS